MIKRLIALVATLLAAAIPLAASAQAEGPWLIRLRGLWMSPTNGNDPEDSVGKILTLDIDPWLFSVGIGYRF